MFINVHQCSQNVRAIHNINEKMSELTNNLVKCSQNNFKMFCMKNNFKMFCEIHSENILNMFAYVEHFRIITFRGGVHATNRHCESKKHK